MPQWEREKLKYKTAAQKRCLFHRWRWIPRDTERCPGKFYRQGYQQTRPNQSAWVPLPPSNLQSPHPSPSPGTQQLKPESSFLPSPLHPGHHQILLFPPDGEIPATAEQTLWTQEEEHRRIAHSQPVNWGYPITSTTSLSCLSAGTPSLQSHLHLIVTYLLTSKSPFMAFHWAQEEQNANSFPWFWKAYLL